MRTKQIDIQLSAMAQAADRRNRPALALVIAGLFMLAGLCYAGANWWNMRSQGSRLVEAERTGERVRSLMAQIQAAHASQLDYATLFPQKIRYELSVVDQANEIWPERNWSFAQLGQVKQSRSVPQIDHLTRAGVRLTIRNEPLEQVLALAERIVAGPAEEFGKSFLASIDLRPMPTDATWTSVIEIDRFEYRRPR